MAPLAARLSVGTLTVLAILLALAPAPTGAVPVVAIQPATLTVNVGQSFTLDVDITGVTDLFAFQFDVAFESALLMATAVNEGAFLPAGAAARGISLQARYEIPAGET